MFNFGVKNLVVIVIIAVVSYAILYFLPASSIDLKLNKKQEEKLKENEEE